MDLDPEANDFLNLLSVSFNKDTGKIFTKTGSIFFLHKVAIRQTNEQMVGKHNLLDKR